MESKQVNIVLVHGAFVDGSGWEGVYRQLTKAGHRVKVVQNPTLSLANDAKVTRDLIDALGGPVILVGHSYGGAIISEAGNHPDVQALVYVTAFAPAAGESVSTLIANPAPGAPVPPIVPAAEGYLQVDPDRFPAAFAGDVDEDKARFMADSQVPWNAAALAEPVTEPAWQSKPSWYLVAADDLMIPPEAQRNMARRAGAQVRETPGSHAFFVVNPDPVADIIAEAAASLVG